MRKDSGVNINPNSTVSVRPRRSLVRRGWVRGVVLIVGFTLVAAVVWTRWLSPAENDDPLALFTVVRGPLVVDVSQSGQIQNRDLVKVRSEVEGRNAIIELVEEGKHVKEGELLVRLDSSGLLEQKEQQELSVLKADAAYVQARENFEVTKSKAKSDVDKAALDYKFAQMDLNKYKDGDYPEELKKAKADILIAGKELDQAQEKVKWSETLAKEGYIKDTELEADRLALTRRKLDLELAESRRKLLEEYTYGRTVEELKSNVEQTKAALDRIERSSKADVIQADAELQSKQKEFNRQKERLAKLDEQIKKCTITAPVAGMVVYATTGGGRRWSQAEPLAEGTEVRERQELIHLPVSTKMMAEVKIHESSLRKIKAEQRVRVTVDAVKGKVYWGRVAKIGLLPDQQSWWLNPDMKVYKTEIYLDGAAEDLRAGMSCHAEIVVATYDDAIYVPVQAVVRVNGRPTAYVVESGEAMPRTVELGLDNDRMVRIVEGLAEGEQVLMAPPLGPSTAPMTTQVAGAAEGVAPPPETGVGGGAPQPSPTQGAGPPEGAGPDQGTSAGQEQTTAQPAFDPSRLRGMSREERRKIRENLTPEQRQQLMRRRRRPRTTESGAEGDAAGPPREAPTPPREAP